MEVGMSGSESQAQSGWAQGSSPWNQGLGGGWVGPQGPTGGQAGSSRQAPGHRAELGPVGWSDAQAQQLTRYIPVGVGP